MKKKTTAAGCRTSPPRCSVLGLTARELKVALRVMERLTEVAGESEPEWRQRFSDLRGLVQRFTIMKPNNRLSGSGEPGEKQ